jgi:hypothetical protein
VDARGGPAELSAVSASSRWPAIVTDARVTLALAALLLAGLAGCASGLMPASGRPAGDAAPYEGVFTGEFVDGKPLYRFPTIEVVGSRNRVGPGT